MLSFNIESDGHGNRYLYVYHEKPFNCRTDCEPESYGNNAVRLPLQEWFHVEAYVERSSYSATEVFNDGLLIVWVNGQVVVEESAVYTLRSPNVRLHWSVNNYTNSISPDHVVLYVDDAAISRTRVWGERPFSVYLSVVRNGQ